MGPPGLAARQKNVRDTRATLAFSDESGFLLLPLVRSGKINALARANRNFHLEN